MVYCRSKRIVARRGYDSVAECAGFTCWRTWYGDPGLHSTRNLRHDKRQTDSPCGGSLLIKICKWAKRCPRSSTVIFKQNPWHSLTYSLCVCRGGVDVLMAGTLHVIWPSGGHDGYYYIILPSRQGISSHARSSSAWPKVCRVFFFCYGYFFFFFNPKNVS